MGWAARANPVAQAAKRREIAPRVKPERKPSANETIFMALWNKMQRRIKQAKTDLIERTPPALQPAMRELIEK